MRVLAITNMYPTIKAPFSGIFVEQQINSLCKLGIDVELLVVERLERGTKSYFGLGKKVQSKIRRLRPDVVHVMYGGVMAEIVTRVITYIPTVVTFHGSDLLGEHLSGWVRSFVAGCGVRASWIAARRATRIIVVSKLLRDALPLAIDRSKIRVIPCGIDLERFRPLDRNTCRHQLGWNPQRFHVIFPANSGDPVKRPALAQAAIDLMNRRGLPTEIHYLRGIENKSVPVWLNASDVLLMTSLHEGSPTVIKEALACDLPVVSVDVGDVSERICGIDGCHITEPHPADIAEKLTFVHRAQRRVAGREKIDELSVHRIAVKLKSVYNELVAIPETSAFNVL